METIQIVTYVGLGLITLFSVFMMIYKRKNHDMYHLFLIITVIIAVMGWGVFGAGVQIYSKSYDVKEAEIMKGETKVSVYFPEYDKNSYKRT